jgi:hypothetical protein
MTSRISRNKLKIEIKLSNVSMFRYPNNQLQMAVVSFEQDYKSNNLVAAYANANTGYLKTSTGK